MNFKDLNFKYVYNEEAEKALLIQLIARPSRMLECSQRLPEEALYNEVYRSFYQICLKFKDDPEEMTLDNLALEINKHGESTEILPQLKIFLSEGTSLTYEEAIKRVELSYAKRKILDSLESVKHQVLVSRNLGPVISKSFEEMIEIAAQTEDPSLEQKNPTLPLLEEFSSRKNNSQMISTGLDNLDRIIEGFQRKHVTVIASRPSVGKTSLACFFMLKALLNKKKVLFFSLETSSRYILYRLLSMETGVNQTSLMNKVINSESRDRIISSLGGISSGFTGNHLKLEDQNLDIREMDYAIRKQKRLYGLDLVFIDYLQIMRVSRYRQGYLEYSDIMQRLKTLAKSENVAIIILSQLSRNVESRENNGPQLSDLAYSGGIEATADIVLLLHREKYYTDRGMKEGKESDTDPIINLVVAKNRNGRVGVSKQYFDLETGFFNDIRETY